MTFRTQATIDANSHKGLILLNSITGGNLVATGKSLTNAQPMHVAVVDGSGSQITSFGQSLSGPPVNGQQTVTTSAVALPSNTLSQGVTIQSLSTNTVSVFIGTSSVTVSGSTGGLELPAGSAAILPVTNMNLIYVICTSGSPVVSFIGV